MNMYQICLYNSSVLKQRDIHFYCSNGFPHPKPCSRLEFLYPLPPPSLFGIFRTLWYKGGIVNMDVCRVQQHGKYARCHLGGCKLLQLSGSSWYPQSKSQGTSWWFCYLSPGSRRCFSYLKLRLPFFPSFENCMWCSHYPYFTWNKFY